MALWLEDNGLSKEALDEALDMVAEEDIAQRKKWGNQRHSIFKWLAIVGEEVGEVNKAALDYSLEEIEKEATQAATLYLKIAYMARLRRKG